MVSVQEEDSNLPEGMSGMTKQNIALSTKLWLHASFDAYSSAAF
jgi:hypothetical protein